MEPVVGMQVDAPSRHRAQEQVGGGLGRHQGQDRGVTCGPQPPRRLVVRRPEVPAGQQRQAGQQQHGADDIGADRGDLAGRPGAPGGRPNRRREQQPTADPAHHHSLPRDQPNSAHPPGQPRPARRHLVRLGPDRLGPVPPPGRHQPRHGAAQPAHRTAGAAAPGPIGWPAPRRSAALRLAGPGAPRPAGPAAPRPAESAGALGRPAPLPRWPAPLPRWPAPPPRWPARRP